MKKKLGLTLIELLAVIAIIAILFILLIPQITKAIDKSRVSGVQVDLHSYEIGMRAYFMEHFGEEKSAEKLNTYLDKSLQFEEVDNKWVSKKELNPYENKYELTSDWNTYMQVNSYTDEKDPRLHAVRVYEEGNEVKSKYIGFDDEKRKSEVDNENPVITISPDGGTDVETVFVEVTDNTEVFSIQYVWSTQEKLTNAQWQAIENNTELSTVFLGKGNYYLHIKASDLDMNTAYKSSKAFVIGDIEYPMIMVTVNGSDEEKIKHITSVSATDNKGVAKLEYAWSDSNVENQVNTPWKEISNNTQVETPNDAGLFYLHVKATDISGQVTYFISNTFNTGDKTKPVISLSVNGSTTEKDEHTTIATVTDNDQVHSAKYMWTTSPTKPTSGKWLEVESGDTLKTPHMNATLYVHIEARDRSGNVAFFTSEGFKTGDHVFPTISLSPNGNNTQALTHKTLLTVTDNKGIEKVEYVWSESEEEPTEDWNTTSNNAELTSVPTDGNVYLYIRAEDSHGNIKKFKSNVFVQSPYTYTVGTEGTTITGYLGNKTELILPSMLGGKPVITIGVGAFSSLNIANKLTSVTLPEKLESIMELAFYQNELTTINFPNTLKSIGNNAFTENSLKTIELKENITTLGKNAFNGNKITELVYPKTITSAGVNVFYGNPITSLTIEEGVKTIPDYAFRVNELEFLRIPSSITRIGDSAFGFSKLKTIQNCSNLSLSGHTFNASPTITKEGC